MKPLVTIEHVSQRFAPTLSLGERIAARIGSPIENRTVHAVDDVSLVIHRGEVLGLAGESGCGKSTLGRIIAGIQYPTTGTALIDDAPVMGGARNRVKTTTRVQMADGPLPNPQCWASIRRAPQPGASWDAPRSMGLTAFASKELHRSPSSAMPT